MHLALHPNETAPPDIRVRAKVDTEAHQVHLEITGFSGDSVVADLKPNFAWDAAGYAPLVTQLMGNNPVPDASKITDPLPDELSNR